MCIKRQAWGTSTHQVPSDVATTAFVTMALIRDSGIHGTHRSAIEKGVDHVLLAIETAPDDSPRLRTPDGTQIQYKLGQLVDTHMASLLLGEVYGKMGGSRHARIQKAYARVLSKVQLAQQADGSFDANGWAPVLSTSIASQGLYKAVDNGVAVDQSVLDRADAYSNAQVSESGEADASDGAGVALYGVASALAGNKQASGRSASPSAARAETKARAMSETIASDSSGALIQGFGSMGGEEMLSYMLISDTLAEDGGKAFTQWDQKIGAHLLNIQNRDGSWVGHHCITSAVFVTAGALATLAAGDSAHARTREAKVRGDRG